MGIVSELIVVTGPPGAGKSTVARVLARSSERSALIAGDEFFGFLARGFIPPWRPETHEQNTVVILLPSIERCIERVRTRIGHEFTDLAATRHMYEQFTRAQIDPRHLVVDPPDGAEVVAECLRQCTVNGSLAYEGHS